MTIATREAAGLKTGQWILIVEGIPGAFSSGASPWATVPDAAWPTVRMETGTNITEQAAACWPWFKLDDGKGEPQNLPRIGEYSVELYGGMIRAGNLRVTVGGGARATA